MNEYKRLYWHISRGEYMPWGEYKRTRAIPSWMRKKYKDDLQKRIEQISIKKVCRKSKVILFS